MGDYRHDDTEPVMMTSSDPEDLNTDDISDSIKYRYYTLPRLRYTNLVRCLLFMEVVTVVILWALAGNNEYFTKKIIHFTMTSSPFDLVLLSVIKVIVLFIMHSQLEDVSLKQIQEPYDPNLKKKKFRLHCCILLVAMVAFIYAAVKGSLILYSVLKVADYEQLHGTEYALVITILVFDLVNLLTAIFSMKAMRRLKLIRILHLLNDDLEEVDKDGQPVKKKVKISRLLGLVKIEWRLLLLAFFCMIISVASTTTAPLYFGKVIDAAQRSMADLNRTVVILLLVYTAGSVAGMFRAWCFELIGQRLVARLRVDIFRAITKQDIAFFDTNRTGELTNRLSSDTQVLQSVLSVNISMLTRQTMSIIGSLGFMFVLDASLTGVLLSVVPIVSLAAVQYGSLVKKIRKRFQDRLADASSTAEEAISGIRTVRSFAREEKTGDIYSSNIDQSYQEGKKLAMAEGGFNGIIGFISYGAVSLVLWYGGKLVVEKKITTGVLTSFILYTLNVAIAFGTFSSLYGQFMQAVGASIRIFEILDRRPDVVNSGDLEIINMSEGIEFKNVKFTYPSRPENPVLKRISFNVNCGEMVALVGPSGGGKSTIVNLIERFYDPDSGSILLGGTELILLNANWFRRQLAMVSQEPILFATSIKDNIAYGKDASAEQIQAVARSANAHQFITNFNEGYDTMVGERGVRLSGGQKQRVAIARALLMDPKILLLDEATSALDAESEYLVQEAIDRAMVNRTVLVIAHRLSTVRQASKVIVIDNGEIAEQGTHDELIKQDGVYKKLVLRQLTSGEHNSVDHLNNGDLINLASTDDALISA